MTNFDTAAARRSPNLLARAALIIGLGFGLAGCETAGNLFGGTSSSEQDAPSAAIAAAPQTARARVTIAPIIGAPDTISKQLAQQLTAAVERHRIVVTKTPGEPSDYVLRGYIVASKDRSAIKISYIWDVTDPAGKRVNRITGEELVADGGAREAWSVVGPNLTQTIADKTAASLNAWMPAKGPAVAGASSAPASVGASPTPPAAPAVATTEPLAVHPTAAAAAPPPAASATGSIGRPEVGSIMPTVSGAPGDGNSALAAALARELAGSGVSFVDAKGGALRIEGRVVVGAPKDGKQTITIDWRVQDKDGRALGTVSQKNEIPQGSLDGAWGRTADAAAAAAAQGIIKLVPTRSAAN